MRSRRNCWNTSAPFRCEWKPSRWLSSALLVLGGLGAIASLNCDLPLRHALPLALLGLAWSCLLVRRELRRPCQSLLIPAPPGAARVDNLPIDALELVERGVLVMLRWRAGKRRGVLLFWPDTLTGAQRRELRLAVRAHSVSRNAETVAP